MGTTLRYTCMGYTALIYALSSMMAPGKLYHGSHGLVTAVSMSYHAQNTHYDISSVGPFSYSVLVQVVVMFQF